MRTKLVFLLALSLATFLLSGCDKGQSQMGPRETNLLGAVKVEKESYSPAGVNTSAISTDELYARKNFTGDKVTLFWGLITLKDY